MKRTPLARKKGLQRRAAGLKTGAAKKAKKPTPEEDRALRGRRKSTRRKEPTLSALKRRVWKLFSEYIRRRESLKNADRTVACYTCGIILPWKKMQCGHFVGGRGNAVLFNEDAVRCQCYVCNVILHGNYQIFTLKMLDEVGKEKVQQLLDLKWMPMKSERQTLMSLGLWYRAQIEGLRRDDA